MIIRPAGMTLEHPAIMPAFAGEASEEGGAGGGFYRFLACWAAISAGEIWRCVCRFLGEWVRHRQRLALAAEG